MPKHTMTAEEARQLFSYNPETGDLIWRVSPCNRVAAGTIAGSLRENGYRYIRYREVGYRAHRVVWLRHYGRWPHGYLDHIDGNTTNNRIENLREASKTENNRNSARHRDNKSGYKGVYYHGQNGVYVASIRADGKKYYLGCYSTPADAHAAYCKAAKELHGDFANFG